MPSRRLPLPAWLLAPVAALALAAASLPRAQAQQATTDVVFVDNFGVDPNGSGVVDLPFDPAGADTMFA